MYTSRISAAYLASDFQKGIPAAFTHLFDLHYRSLCYYAGTILDDIGEVEDAVSEVFVKLWQRAANFDDSKTIPQSIRNGAVIFLTPSMVKMSTFRSHNQKLTSRMAH